MEYRLIISEEAEKDLIEILSHINQKLCNDIASSKLLIDIHKKYEYIRKFPKSYQILYSNYHTKFEYRKTSISNYTIIYHILNHNVYIWRLIHNDRDYLFNQKVSQLKEDTFEYSAV